MKTNITAVITPDNQLVITLPLSSNPTLTKNGKNYVVAQTGTWPNNWVTVNVDGEDVGLTVCALVKNPEHPANKPQPVVAPSAPKFFNKAKLAPAGVAEKTGNAKTAWNGKRTTPASVA